MLDVLTDLTPTPDKTDPRTCHKFAAAVLEIAWREQDVALIGLATELSASALKLSASISSDTPGVSFLRKHPHIMEIVDKILLKIWEIQELKNPSARVNLTIEKLPSEVQKYPSQATKDKIAQLKNKGCFLYGLGECWSCFFIKKENDDTWKIFVVNSRFSTKYAEIISINAETPLSQLLGPLLNSDEPLLGTSWNKHVNYVLNKLNICIECHDHDYDVIRERWEDWKYQYHDDMGIRMHFSFDDESEAKNFWKEIIALSFEDLFLPGFVNLLPTFVEKVPTEISGRLEEDLSDLD